ncbi:hypothetical protein GJ496_005768 [Pomphorhynchus laevis]|nr:hypothetical protein GJ496_005768 [Pomphorhynchus laevis]
MFRLLSASKSCYLLLKTSSILKKVMPDVVWNNRSVLNCQPVFDSLRLSNKDSALKKFKDLLQVEYPVHIETTIHNESVIAFTMFRKANLDTGKYIGVSRILTVEKTPSENTDVYMNNCVPIGKFISCAINLDTKLIITLRLILGKHILIVMNFESTIIRAIDITETIPNSLIYIPPNPFQAIVWSPDNSSIAIVIKCGGSSIRTTPRSYESILYDSMYSDDEWAAEYGDGGSSTIVIGIIVLSPYQLHIVYIPHYVWPSDINWYSDSKTLFFIGTKMPKNLKVGKIDFSNRPSNIYKVYRRFYNDGTFQYKTDSYMKGSDEFLSLHSLRISPDFKYMAYTAHLSYGPQVQCRHLCLSEIESIGSGDINRHKVLYGNVDWKQYSGIDEHENLHDAYVGLYSDLPISCWTDSSEYLVFHSENGFSTNLFAYVLDIEDVPDCSESISDNQTNVQYAKRDELYKLKTPTTAYTDQNSSRGSFKVMSVFDCNKVIVKYSNCVHSFTLILGHLQKHLFNSFTLEVIWVQLLSGPIEIECVKRLLYSRKFPGFETTTDEALLLVHKDDIEPLSRRENPTIVYMHDYAHNRFADDYMDISVDILVMVHCGFNVILLNTVGSIGYGAKSIELVKELGYIETTKRSAEGLLRACLETYNLKTDRIVAYAKSWSSTVLLNVLADSSNIFIAAVLENPVCENVTMYVNSDVPDNAWRELTAGFQDHLKNFEFNYQIVHSLMQRNPICLYGSITTPMLFLLSTRDQRAPYLMGLRYKKLHESRSMTSKVRIYPERHKFRGISVRADAFVHTYAFYIECISKYLMSIRIMTESGMLL